MVILATVPFSAFAHDPAVTRIQDQVSRDRLRATDTALVAFGTQHVSDNGSAARAWSRGVSQPGRDLCVAGSRACFFEKKKQKAFVSAVAER